MTISGPRSILILRLSALGDIIHTLPAVVALRDAWPSAKLGWIVEQPFVDLVRQVAPVDEVFPVATRRWRRNPLAGRTREEAAAFERSVREFARGETAIDFQGLLKSAALARISRAEHRYGFSAGAVRERAAGLFYNKRVSVDRSRHVVEWNMDLARAAGATASLAPSIRERCLGFASGTSQLASLMTSRTVVLNPGAGRSTKQWGVDRFAALAGRIRQELHLDPLVIWGPGEQEAAGRIAMHSGARLAPPTSLPELTFLLSRAPILVAGDTGPLHLAAAMGTPLVGLFGPTNPARNGPYGALDHVIESHTSTQSMDSIPVEAVFRRVEAVWR